MKRTLVLILTVLALFYSEMDLYAQAGQDALMGLTPNTIFLPRSEQPQAPDTTAFLERVNSPEDVYYNGSAVTKGSEGLLNVTTFWAEVPQEIYDTTADSNILNGLTFGFARGLIYGFGRGAAGVIDTTTCVLPPYDDPIVQPQYTVKNPQKDGFKVALFEW